jgi:glycosyltransferase involved in cell wall biosynthesis
VALLEYPLISIITPTYNREAYLSETIESVLRQDYPNFEYLVLDDGSTDNTRQLVTRYDDPRLQYRYHNNMGETQTVNKGFQMAKGAYIVVVNSDDPLLPDFMRKAVDFMQSRPELLVAYPGWIMIDENSNLLQEQPMYEYNYVNMVKWHYCMPGAGAIITRKALELVPGRDPAFRYRGDYDFWLQVGLHGPFAYLPEVLATWRTHSEGATSNINERMIMEHIEVIEKLYNTPNLPEAVKKVRREAFCNAYYTAGYICRKSNPALARRLLLRSILYKPFAPIHYPMRTRSWKMMLQTILPRFIIRLYYGIRKLKWFLYRNKT